MSSHNGTPGDHLEVKDWKQRTVEELEEERKKMKKDFADEIRSIEKKLNETKRSADKPFKKNNELEKHLGKIMNKAYSLGHSTQTIDKMDGALDDSNDGDGRVDPFPVIKPIKEMRTSSAIRASVVNDQRQPTIADKVLIEAQKKLHGQWDERWGGNANSTTGLPNKKDSSKKPLGHSTHEPALGRQSPRHDRQAPRDGLYSGNNYQKEKETSDDDSEHAKSYQDDITAPHPFSDDQLHDENDHFEEHVVRGEESEDEQVEMDEEDVEDPEDPEVSDEEAEQTTFAQKIMEMMKRMAFDEKVCTIYADPRYGHRDCLWDPSAAETVVQVVRTVPKIDVLMRTGASRTLYRPKYNCENETPATWAQRKEDLLEEQKVQVKMGIIRVVPVRKIRK